MSTTALHLFAAPVIRQAVAARPLQRIETEALHVHEARIVAVRKLGRNWVSHPAYDFNPRHSSNPDIYKPAREAYLQGVAERAAHDRERNPAYRRASALRDAVSA